MSLSGWNGLKGLKNIFKNISCSFLSSFEMIQRDQPESTHDEQILFLSRHFYCFKAKLDPR